MEALFSDYEAIRKSGLFDPEHYVKTYPDVAERNVDPLVHYLEEGARAATRTRISIPPFTSNNASSAARSSPTRCCIIC